MLTGSSETGADLYLRRRSERPLAAIVQQTPREHTTDNIPRATAALCKPCVQCTGGGHGEDGGGQPCMVTSARHKATEMRVSYSDRVDHNARTCHPVQ